MGDRAVKVLSSSIGIFGTLRGGHQQQGQGRWEVGFPGWQHSPAVEGFQAAPKGGAAPPFPPAHSAERGQLPASSPLPLPAHATLQVTPPQ